MWLLGGALGVSQDGRCQGDQGLVVIIVILHFGEQLMDAPCYRISTVVVSDVYQGGLL